MDINYYKQFEPIDGKWYITKELGSGAFGTVFEIERRDFSQAKSALKVITIPSSPNEVNSYREDNYDLDEKSISSYFYGFVEEFTDEFKLMTKLRGNSNIVSIEDYDVIEHKDEIGWDIFIRMELLTPMNKYFRDHELSQRDIIKLGIDICKALEICQKYKIIHRDIKPSNIFVSDTGDFKLGDFGVSRTLEKTSSGLSKKGTYTYMAPEVFKGEAYGTNVDIYSLGIVMYKLLNNNFEPFRTVKTYADEEESLNARMNGKNIPKPANAEGRLAEIVLKACSFNPKDRYESPKQMREELENIFYSELEGKVIYPNGDEVNYEQSIRNIIERDDNSEITVSVFDNNKANDLEQTETIGLFDNVKKQSNTTVFDEETVGVFGETKESTETLSNTSNDNSKDVNSLSDYSKKTIRNKRKWIMLITLAIIGICLIVGVGKNVNDNSSNPSTQNVVNPNNLNNESDNNKNNTQVLKVATSASFEPLEFLDSEGKIVGFDIDLLEALSKDIGFEYEIENMDYDKLLSSVAEGKYDIVISGIEITGERREYLDFSNPYLMVDTEEGYVEYGIVCQNNSELLNRINDCIEEYVFDGRITVIAAQYSIDYAIDRMKLCYAAGFDR